MDAETWHRNKDRPAVVREHREELMEQLSVEEPIPDTDSLAEVRDWLERYKSTVTHQLSENTTDEGESDSA